MLGTQAKLMLLEQKVASALPAKSMPRAWWRATNGGPDHGQDMPQGHQ